MIPAEVILVWTGLNAAIPAGWERVPSLDGKFAKGTDGGVDPNVTGGADTHAHTSPAHIHTMVSHAHSGETDNAHNSDESQCDNSQNSQQTRDNHHHDFNIAGVSGGNLNNAITYAAVSSDPPFSSVIFIKPSGVGANITANILCFWATANVPTNFSFCDGTGGTPDLRNKYLKGAATSADAGATGGTLNHIHAVNHTHSAVSHSHSGTTASSTDHANSNDSTTRPSSRPHSHAISLGANGAEASSAYTANTDGTEVVEPLYKKVLAIMNTSGIASQPRGVIGMWLGLLEDIPFGWLLCNGLRGTPDLMAYHLKVANTTAEVLATGGANAHIHAASNSHTHTASGTHTHSGSTDTMYANGPGSYGAFGLSRNHYHSTSSVSSPASSWNYTTVTANSADGQPAFRTVAFIQYRFSKGMSQII